MKKPMVLIADDDEINRDILRSMLENEYQFLEAADGREAITKLAEHEDEVDCVITDLVMPKMDGFDFLREYSANEAWRNIPVLVATGDTRVETEQRCLDLGAWDVIRKPFSYALVYLRLRNNISRRRLHQMEKQKLTDMFQRYIDPSVLKQLLRTDISAAELDGESKDIVVMFADIRGFTSIAEKLRPEEVVDLLNTYLTIANNAVKRHGGTLDKFIGDCTMAFWGAPLPCEDAAYFACLAAKEIMAEAKQLDETMKKRFGHAVTFGIGIQEGYAVVGNLGAPDRLDYTAVGDTVNTASRLESIASSGTILISRLVADCLGERAKTTSYGNVLLKGKEVPIEVLSLDELIVGEVKK